jgi:alkylhydroperoxidase family enzyme
VLEDYESAPIPEPLRATLAFLKKLSLEPTEISAEDVRALLGHGLSREAIRDAIYVCYLFNTYDRVADALGWHVPGASVFEASAKHLLSRGYR